MTESNRTNSLEDTGTVPIGLASRIKELENSGVGMVVYDNAMRRLEGIVPRVSRVSLIRESNESFSCNAWFRSSQGAEEQRVFIKVFGLVHHDQSNPLYEQSVKILSGNRSPFLPKLIQCQVLQHRLFAYFMTEHGPASLLGDEIARSGMPVHRLYGVIRQIAEGLTEIHNSGGLHLNLKPASILIRGDKVQLLPRFGSWTEWTKQKGALLNITPAYAPPELDLTSYMERPRPSYDVYSLGWVMVDLLAGIEVAGFLRKNQNQLNRRLDAWSESADTRAVAESIRHALNPDPAKRFNSARELSEFFASFRSGVVQEMPTNAPAVKDVAIVTQKDLASTCSEPIISLGTTVSANADAAVVGVRRASEITVSLPGNSEAMYFVERVIPFLGLFAAVAAVIFLPVGIGGRLLWAVMFSAFFLVTEYFRRRAASTVPSPRHSIILQLLNGNRVANTRR